VVSQAALATCWLIVWLPFLEPAEALTSSSEVEEDLKWRQACCAFWAQSWKERDDDNELELLW